MLTKDQIKSIACEVGFHASGMTQVKSFPESESVLREWTKKGKHGEMKYMERFEERKNNFWSRFPNAKSIIVLGVNYYSNHARHSEPLFGRVARYAWGQDYHKLIAEKIETLKSRLKEKVPDDIYFESAVDTQPLFERTLGQQAGLGFIGKQTQLLSLQFGPWLFLSELITNLELEPDQPYHGSCGTCRLCIDECPTGAIEESGGIDARKCVAYLTIEHKTEIPEEFRRKIGGWVFGCDECLNVCPYTAKQKETTWKELTSENGFGSALDLLKLFEPTSNRAHKRQFRNSAISRASRKQLVRNAAIVLGNQADERALPVLREAMNEAGKIVKDHLEWAIRSIENRTKPS